MQLHLKSCEEPHALFCHIFSKCSVQFGLTFQSHKQHLKKTILEYLIPKPELPYHQKQRDCTESLMPKVYRWCQTCCRSCQCSLQTGWALPCLAALWQNETQQPSRTSVCAGISAKTTSLVAFKTGSTVIENNSNLLMEILTLTFLLFSEEKAKNIYNKLLYFIL